METPSGAIWFGVEVKTGADAWQRMDERALGGKWWRVGTTTPEEITAKLADVAGVLVCRILWSPKDRRTSLGTSPPFEVSPVLRSPGDDDEAEGPPAPPPPQIATETQQPKQQGGVPRTQVQQAAAPAPPGAPYAPPMVPMPFTPPPLGTSDPLSQLVYIHSLVHQDKLAHQQQVLSMATLMIEGERARSRESVKAMELHYSSIDKSRADMQRALAAESKTDPQLEALAVALGALGAKVDDLSELEPETQLATIEPNATEVQKMMGAVGTILNSPAGQVIAKMIQSKLTDHPGTAPPAPLDDHPEEAQP